MALIEQRISESIAAKQRILADPELIRQIQLAADWIRDALDHGGKVLFCGNGGSASDALHLAGEFVGRFQKERKALPAIALNADNAVLTSIANDYGYKAVFARAVEGLMLPQDVLVGISTSGNSQNVYEGLLAAGRLGGKTIALLGKDGGIIRNIADLSLIVPDAATARIQECHILIGHIICELVET